MFQGVSGGGHPRAMERWGPGIQLGQVSGVSVDPQGRPVIVHRGPRVWDQRKSASVDSRGSLPIT
ncbi:hypothetical protein E2C01_005068 [Portunus trituberculatus]|uniref:Uncharacterized protein n=1 Tax=Portunus trituberculatus TaxID=210409 RepID=A0A5B7CTA3_PORTR|nr:hypothetical protein [Portunus trituberculatus]